jgi:hypothetical protein
MSPQPKRLPLTPEAVAYADRIMSDATREVRRAIVQAHHDGYEQARIDALRATYGGDTHLYAWLRGGSDGRR